MVGEQVKDVLGVFGLCLSPLGVKSVNFSSSTVRQWGGLILCLLFAVAAMLSKETGITVLLICATYDLLRSSRIWPGVSKTCNFLRVVNCLNKNILQLFYFNKTKFTFVNRKQDTYLHIVASNLKEIPTF